MSRWFYYQIFKEEIIPITDTFRNKKGHFLTFMRPVFPDIKIIDIPKKEKYKPISFMIIDANTLNKILM